MVMKSKIKRLLKLLIGWPLSILALFFIVRTFLPRMQHVQQFVSNPNYWLLGLGVLSFLSYYFLRSLVWQRLLQAMGYKIPYEQTVFYWASSEIKRYIPGNIWSFVGRSVAFSEKGMSKKDIAKALVLEQEMVLLGGVIAAVLSLPFLGRFVFPWLRDVPFLYQIVLLVLLVGIVLFVSSASFSNRIPLTLPSPLVRGINLIRHLSPDFLPGKTFWMILLSGLAFLFFGLGYYFTISSFVFLHPQEYGLCLGFLYFLY
jgi:uncharacterized membrane protein YbhN (UPF0104 family)